MHPSLTTLASPVNPHSPAEEAQRREAQAAVEETQREEAELMRAPTVDTAAVARLQQEHERQAQVAQAKAASLARVQAIQAKLLQEQRRAQEVAKKTAEFAAAAAAAPARKGACATAISEHLTHSHTSPESAATALSGARRAAYDDMSSSATGDITLKRETEHNIPLLPMLQGEASATTSGRGWRARLSTRGSF